MGLVGSKITFETAAVTFLSLKSYLMKSLKLEKSESQTSSKIIFISL
jgi:hypothetical protein